MPMSKHGGIVRLNLYRHTLHRQQVSMYFVGRHHFLSYLYPIVLTLAILENNPHSNTKRLKLAKCIFEVKLLPKDVFNVYKISIAPISYTC